MGKLDGKKIAFLQTDGVEQVELEKPLEAIRGEGAEVTLVSLEEGEFQAFNHLDKGDTFTADATASDADASRFHGLVLPGGVANPDFLRADRGRRRLRPRLLRAGQAGRGDLPRAVDAGRGRRA